jgi:hypothetical protein
VIKKEDEAWFLIVTKQLNQGPVWGCVEEGEQGPVYGRGKTE